MDFVTNGSRFACRSTTLTRVILGYAALGNMALLLIAASVRITKGRGRGRSMHQRERARATTWWHDGGRGQLRKRRTRGASNRGDNKA